MWCASKNHRVRTWQPTLLFLGEKSSNSPEGLKQDLSVEHEGHQWMLMCAAWKTGSRMKYCPCPWNYHRLHSWCQAECFTYSLRFSAYNRPWRKVLFFFFFLVLCVWWCTCMRAHPNTGVGGIHGVSCIFTLRHSHSRQGLSLTLKLGWYQQVPVTLPLPPTVQGLQVRRAMPGWESKLKTSFLHSLTVLTQPLTSWELVRLSSLHPHLWQV